MSRPPSNRPGERDSGGHAPLAAERRRGVLAFGLHLYHSDPKFRGFFDFAVIGMIVFLFLHPPSLPSFATLLSFLVSSDEAASTEQNSLGSILQKTKAPFPKAPTPRDLEVDLGLFDSSVPEVRQQLRAAAETYAEKRAAQALEILNLSDLKDPNVIMMRGLAMMALPGFENFPAGIAALEQAVAGGQRQAQTYLALLYIAGPIGVERDPVRGGELLRNAAEDGDIVAARLLGMAYSSGWVNVLDNGLAVKYLRLAVEGGDAEASMALAYFAYQGIGMAKDGTEAVRLLEVAAQDGHVPAQGILGMHYLTEFVAGWKTDPTPAAEWLGRAAEAGDPEAMLWLGLLHGELTKEPPWHDPEKAAGLLRACADKWYGPCLFSYADALRQGRGVARDLATAHAYFSLAREQGHLKAKPRLAELEELLTRPEVDRANEIAKDLKTRRSHRSMVPNPNLPTFQGLEDQLVSKSAGTLKQVLNPEEFTILLRRPKAEAAATIDTSIHRAWHGAVTADDVALYERATDLIEGRKRTEAQSLLKPRAETGDPNAQFLLAFAYINRRYSWRHDRRIFSWMQKAASQGHVEASYQLGNYYRFAVGTKKDSRLAVDWYAKAVSLGNTRAATALGDAYLTGKDVPLDAKKAVELYELAAEGGDVAAWAKLGFHRYNGTVGEKDMAEARKWTEKAAHAGSAQAQWNLAVWLASGELGPADNDKSYEWASKAALQDHIEATHYMGEYYRTGADGTKDVDPERAFRFLRTAAFRNHAQAQFRYAEFHEQGITVPGDIVKAFLFYTLASNHGDVPAWLGVQRLLPALTCEQFLRAKKAVGEWPRINPRGANSGRGKDLKLDENAPCRSRPASGAARKQNSVPYVIRLLQALMG